MKTFSFGKFIKDVKDVYYSQYAIELMMKLDGMTVTNGEIYYNDNTFIIPKKWCDEYKLDTETAKRMEEAKYREIQAQYEKYPEMVE